MNSSYSQHCLSVQLHEKRHIWPVAEWFLYDTRSCYQLCHLCIPAILLGWCWSSRGWAFTHRHRVAYLIEVMCSLQNNPTPINFSKGYIIANADCWNRTYIICNLLHTVFPQNLTVARFYFKVQFDAATIWGRLDFKGGVYRDWQAHSSTISLFVCMYNARAHMHAMLTLYHAATFLGWRLLGWVRRNMWQHFKGSGISRYSEISRKYGTYC